MSMAAQTVFTVPSELEAAEPPEEIGIDRDQVRLLVARPGAAHHARFAEIATFLCPGDLLVVNTSATVPAAVDGSCLDGRPVVVHFASSLDDGTCVVELRHPDGSGPVPDAHPGQVVDLPAGRLTLVGHPDGGVGPGRLWVARVVVATAVETYLQRHGRPITYGYLTGRWPLSAYQTIFGRQPGSAEMASAGRPFTDRLVTELVTNGILIAPVLLHAGVSSPDRGEPPQPERYHVPETTARLVNQTRTWDGRVVAVGTTVVRALETVARPDGSVAAGEGWTELVLGPRRRARTVTGLVTGWHAPDASHLTLLEAVAGAPLVGAAYRSALDARYRWHEFGDSCLFLP